MTPNYKINAAYAISKAKGAVASWEQALTEQTVRGNKEGIKFCQDSLDACKANLAHVRKDVKENWTAYL